MLIFLLSTIFFSFFIRFTFLNLYINYISSRTFIVLAYLNYLQNKLYFFFFFFFFLASYNPCLVKKVWIFFLLFFFFY